MSRGRCRAKVWVRSTLEALEPRRVLHGAMGDYFSVPMGASDWRLDVLANDIASGLSEEATIVEVSRPNLLGIVRTDGRALYYSFPEGKVGSEQFEYTVQDAGQIYTAQVYTSVDRLYLAVPDYQRIAAGQAVQLDVLANDPVRSIVPPADPAGKVSQPPPTDSPVRIVHVSDTAAGGTVTIVDGGASLRYQPPEGFIGVDRFTYRAEGEWGADDEATVTIEVEAQPPDPGGIGTFTPLGLEQALVEQAAARFLWNFGRVQPHSVPGAWYPAYVDTPVLFGREPTEDTGGDFSGTNVQVAGVDEADIVKTDGEFLYLVQTNQIVVVDARQPDSLAIAARVPLEMQPESLYLLGDRLVVVGFPTTQYVSAGGEIGASEPPVRWAGTQVVVLDVSDPVAPGLLESFTFSGSALSSRAVGDEVHFIFQEYLQLPPPEATDSEKPGLDEFESFDEYVTKLHGAEALDATLPAVRRGEGDWESQVAADQVYQTNGDLDISQLITITTLDVGAGLPVLAPSTSIPASWSNTVYATADDLYVLRYAFGGGGSGSPDGDSTEILKLQRAEAQGPWELAATGSVPGQVLNQFSIDQYDGHLRVATTRRDTGGQQSSGIYVLQQEGDRLGRMGEVENLAPGERIYSVRFLGERAYVVTFRQIDPLFTVDLADSAHPQVVGELKIPGFSNYLHPVQEDYLIGIGENIDPASGSRLGPQISLFDVSDLARPRRIGQFNIPSAGWSAAQYDHHAVSYFDEISILALPFSVYEPAPGGSGEGGKDDSQLWQWGSRLWVLEVDPQAADPQQVLHELGTVRQPDEVLRSLRIGDSLFSLSRSYVTVVELEDLTRELDSLYYGRLAFDDYVDLSVQGGETVVDVLANDYGSQAGGTGLSVVSVTAPGQGGEVEVLSDGRIAYRPAEGFTGTETFRYTVQGQDGESDSATVRVQVHAAPEAGDDTFQVRPDSQRQTLDVLRNDRADGGDFGWPGPAGVVPVLGVTGVQVKGPGIGPWRWPSLVVTEVSQGDRGGQVAIASGGWAVEYQPAPEFVGTETFTYQARDPWGGTDSATVTVYVSAEGVGVISATTNGGQDSADRLDSVEVRFSQDIGAALQPGLLMIRDESGQVLDTESASLDWDAAAQTARWDLSELDLPPGWYELSLDAPDEKWSWDGNADGVSGDGLEMRIHVRQPGDVDLDGDVDALDLSLLTEHWTGALPAGSGDRQRSEGDVDGDGDIDVADLADVILHWTGAQAGAESDAPAGSTQRVAVNERAAAVDQVFAEPSAACAPRRQLPA